MDKSSVIVRVAVPAPLSRGFDYLLAEKNLTTIRVDSLAGVRVEVPFGRGVRIGVVLERLAASEVESAKLKAVRRVLDSTPVLPPAILHLVRWASHYYHCPIGEALATALPRALRKIRSTATPKVAPTQWRLTNAGRALPVGTLCKAPLQQKILDTLCIHQVTGGERFARLGAGWRNSLVRLCQAGWVEPCRIDEQRAAAAYVSASATPVLNSAQQAVLAQLQQSRGTFQAYLLEGVTGSGKTEIYLRHSAEIVAASRQVLVIVPEIGLTPQLVARFTARFGASVVALHSGLSDGERLRNWYRVGAGHASVVVGTRSSVFVPCKALGLIVVDEEHDASLKQQDGFRYHARDLALVRARNEDIPILLGSATPSLETLHNARIGRYCHLLLKQRAGDAHTPVITLLDVRRAPLNQGLSAPLIQHLQKHLERDNQVMLFLNRRGYAPVMLCDDCGEALDCHRCNAHMTVHAASRRLRCHHCGAQQAVPTACPHCGGRTLVMAGQGTERLDYALRAAFPAHAVVRIDRDTTRRVGALQSQLEVARSGAAKILIGTQMLAKGHHFPEVTLVAILDVDRGLYGVDFRAAEQMAQTIVQVAGRAGRARRVGEVLIQTRDPQNPLFQTLIHSGYSAFASTLLEERKVLGLPPYGRLALVRAAAVDESTPRNFLRIVKSRIDQRRHHRVQVLGPTAAPIERVAGRYRAQLLLSTPARGALHRLLDELRPALESMPESRKVRWSLDVDPVALD